MRIITLGAFVLSTIVICSMNIERRDNPNLKTIKKDWVGNMTINGRFYNDSTVVRSPLWRILKWKLGSNPQKAEKRHDAFKLEVEPISDFSSQEDRIVWLGHSSFFISINGVKLITDPCLFDLPTTKRAAPLPCDTNKLTNIDYLLLSHDHRDHLDKKTITKIAANNSSLKILAPLGAKKRIKNIAIQEAGWFQRFEVGNDIQIIFLPARHWGRRGLNDYNKVLWGSFLIIDRGVKIFFAGDSAYDKRMFQDIHALFGDIDICLLPIGAYAPQWLMASEHMNPEEAFEAFNDLGGKLFIPMHYGTYDLADEPMGEPIARLRELASLSHQADKIMELPIGKVHYINNTPNTVE